MRAPRESRPGDLADLLHELGDGIHGFDKPDDDRGSLPHSMACALEAEWIVLREHGGAWVGANRRGVDDRFHAEQASRRIDFGLVERVPRGRLIRLAGPILGRSARFAGMGLREVVVYRDPCSAGSRALVVIALSKVLAVDPRVLDGLLRAWVALSSLRSRIAQAEGQDRLVELGTRAACALHDLRHELTVASLELDRLSAEHASIPEARLARVRTAIAAARALCEGELEVRPPAETVSCRVAALLRTEIDAARSVAGRGGAVRVDVRCDRALEFPVDPGLLSRILRNLVLNAIENSPDGEPVSIEAEIGSRAELVLRVIDHGRGLSAADREDLFRFGRSGRGGWGIGMSSIGTCARRIGATHTIESRRGSGTCVELRIPPAGGRADA